MPQSVKTPLAAFCASASLLAVIHASEGDLETAPKSAATWEILSAGEPK